MKKYGMDAIAVDKQVAALRESDAVVASRLAELDGKLTAWLAAMREALAALKTTADRERLRTTEAAVPEPAVEPPVAVAEPVELSGQAASASPPGEPVGLSPALNEPASAPCRGRVPTRDESAITPEAPGGVDNAAESSVRPPAKRKQTEKTPVVRSAETATADASASTPADTVAEQAPAPGAGPAPDAAAEDEALLAQLDPETANALRVKRRLTGNRKSIRQLLDEMQASGGPGTPPPAPKSKRWWR